MWLLDRPIAHRGLHDKDGKEVTENSPLSFQKAIDKNYFIETDVRLLADGEVVVFHDSTLKRVCGKDVAVASLTTADIKGNDYLLPNGEHIPLFKEMLEQVNGQTKILLELKWVSLFNHNLEKKVYELIKGKEEWITLQSFSPFIMTWFRKNAPTFTQGFLSSYIKSSFCNCGVTFFNKRSFRSMKPDFLSFNVQSLPAKGVDNLLAKYNIPLIIWTARSQEDIAKAKAVGAKNIIFENTEPLDGNYM